MCTSIIQKFTYKISVKKPGLDENTFKTYRPVSNLPFVSKVLEIVVSTRIEKTFDIK